MGRVLGIDFGTKRVGLALSDPMMILASGAGTLPNDGKLIDGILSVVSSNDVTRIVVGMPYSEDGGKGQMAREVDQFVGRLQRVLSLPIETWDESLTSEEAKSSLRASGMKRSARRKKGRVDEMAARLLLQGFLDQSGS